MPSCGRVWWGWGLLLFSGCGLADYEAKMKDAQERLRQYQEQEKLLDPAPRINPPTKITDPQLPPTVVLDFQLRAPRGISSQAPANARLELFYDYRPVKPQAAEPFQWLSLAFAPRSDSNFVSNLLGRLPALTQPKQSDGQTRLGLKYRRLEFESQSPLDGQLSSVAVYLFQGTSHQLAVIFFVTKGQLARATRAIEMSLDTLGFDDTLAKARQAERPGGPLEFVPR